MSAPAVQIEGVDLPVSQLALGTHFYGSKEQETWHGILDAYLEHGGTVVDTARGYGESETVIGQWLRSRGGHTRAQVLLITKGGHGQAHGLPRDQFAATIERELTESLQRLGTERVELYMLHRDSPTVPVGEIMDCLNGELNRGRVLALGASNWTYERVTAANQYAAEHGLRGFAVVSNNLSLARQAEPFHPGLISVDDAGRRWHQETGIPLIIWSSQARGFFTGRFMARPGEAAAGDKFAQRMAEVYGTDDNFERLRRCEQRAAGGTFSAIQVALAWLLHQPLPLVPIVGAHNTGELASCFAATELRLTQAELEWLDLEREDRPGS